MLVVYIFQSKFGNNEEGDRIELEPDQAQPLVDAGVLEEATDEDTGEGEPEDMGGDDDAYAPEQDASMRAIKRAINDVAKQNKKTEDRIVAALTAKAKKPNLAPPAVRVIREEPVIKGIGDLCRTIYQARVKNSTSAMHRLHNHETQQIRLKAPAGANEGTNSQGGYAVIPQWYKEIWDKARDYPRLLDKTERIPISGDTLNIPAISETSLADGSRHGGVLAYWVNEGATATQSYAALSQVQAVLNTQVVMIPITNQLLQDISFPIDEYIQRQVGNEFVFQENVAVMNGSGSGQPLGVLNQAALVTASKDTNDAASGGALSYADLANMYKRMWGPSKKNAEFYVNPTQWNHLLTMTFPNAASTSTFPAFGLSYDARDEVAPLRFFGRPVIDVLNMATAGTVGDIVFADLSQLVCAEKPEMQVDVSDAVYFTSLQTVFRFVRRYDIRSPWTAALTPYDGSTSTFSPFITLQARGS